MTDHPLTEQQCELLSRQPWLDPDVDVEGTIHDMRAAYDFAVEKIHEEWNRVLESDLYLLNKENGLSWLNEQAAEEFFSKYPKISSFGEVLKAMRPQVVDLPQANSDVCGEEGMKRARQRTFEENDELMRKLADS